MRDTSRFRLTTPNHPRERSAWTMSRHLGQLTCRAPKKRRSGKRSSTSFITYNRGDNTPPTGYEIDVPPVAVRVRAISARCFRLCRRRTVRRSGLIDHRAALFGVTRGGGAGRLPEDARGLGLHRGPHGPAVHRLPGTISCNLPHLGRPADDLRRGRHQDRSRAG
jgi:hypothetical protein